jgi:ubiquitin C-terminal hydrolase
VTIERAHGPQLLMLEFAHGAHTNVADSIQRSTVIAGNLLFMGGSYTVCGLLYHTANRGHYVAELLHADGWHHYDDLLESTVPIAAPRAALNSPKGSLLLLLGALFERR